MNYYSHHIGDFNNATRHLSRVERSIYRDLMDLYYDRETPVPTDVERVCKLVLAVTPEEVAAVQFVLNEFFVLADDGWHNSRCDDEIEAYRAKHEQASRAGKASAERRKLNRTDESTTDAQQSFSERSTDVQPTNNQEPRTNNQEPEIKQQRRRAAVSVVRPEGLSDSVWSDFLSIRKAKRAPLTQTALDGIEREAAKAGMTLADALAECCSRGWQGFKAEWVANRPNAQRQTIHDERKATLDALTGRSNTHDHPFTIDAQATRVA